jgi:hypothetical protein
MNITGFCTASDVLPAVASADKFVTAVCTKHWVFDHSAKVDRELVFAFEALTIRDGLITQSTAPQSIAQSVVVYKTE